MATQNTWFNVDNSFSFNDANDWTDHQVPGSDGEDISLIGGSLVTMNGVTVVADDVQSAVALYINSGASLTTTTATNDSFIEVGGTFSLNGSMTNVGTIEVATGGQFDTGPGAAVTGGTVSLAGGTLFRTGSLNLVGANISGDGLIDGDLSQLQMDAQSTIEASGGTLTLSIGTGPHFEALNGGVIEAANGSTLVIIGDVENTTSRDASGTTTTGVIEADADYPTGSSVVYLDGCSIIGGSLETLADGGAFKVGDGSSVAGTATISNLTLNANLYINQNDTLNLSGHITFDGGFIANSGSIVLHGNVTITGPAGYGPIDPTGGSMTDNNTGATLTLRTNIQGYGTIGDATMVFYNYGSIDDEGEVGALHLVLGDSTRPTSVNEVKSYIGSYGKGQLTEFQSGGKGTSNFTNLGELYTNQDATLSIDHVHLTNISDGVLSGGTYVAEGGATFDFYEGFSTLDASLTLSDAGTVMQATSTGKNISLQSMLKTISAGGALTFENLNYTTTNALTLNGSLTIGGTLTSGVTIAGKSSIISTTNDEDQAESGTIASLITDAGSVVAFSGSPLIFKGAKNAFSGTLSGSGTIAFAGGTDTFSKGIAWTVSTLTASAANLVLTTAVTDTHAFRESASTITFAGGSLTLGAATLNGGSVTGTGTLSLDGTTTSTGFSVLGGATLVDHSASTLTGKLTLGSKTAAGVTSGTALIASGGVLLLDAGASIGVAAGGKGSIINTGLIEGASGSKNAVIAAPLVNTGSIVAKSGTLDISGAVTGIGKASVSGGATLEFDAAVAATQAVSFGIVGGKLVLDDAKQFDGTISGFGANDTLDIGHWGKGTSLTYTVNAKKTGGTLAIKNGGTTDDITLIGTFSASGFHLTTGSAGDTLVTYAAPKSSAAHADAFTTALFDAAFGQAPNANVTEAATTVLSHTAMLSATDLHGAKTTG